MDSREVCVKRWISVLFLSAAAAVRAAAQQDARPLLHQVVATYKSARSFHFESAMESYLSSEMHQYWSRSREVLIRDQPDRVRYEVIASDSSFVVVSDGKTLWRASHDTREFIRTALTGPLFETKGGGPLAESSLQMSKFMMNQHERLEEHLSRAEQIGEEAVEVDGKPIACVVVRADYSPPKGSIGIESWTRTFWIDKERRIVLKEDSVTRGKLIPSRPFEDVENTRRRRYTVASINEPVPASLFVYTPPQNFREVDKLERAFPRPAKDLIGKQAPDLSLQTLTGETLRLADLRGKIVLLDFWATWCEPCRRQLPALAKLYQEVKDQGVVLLGVSDDETPQKALQFLQERGYGWPSLYDGKQKEARSRYKVDGIPVLVLIDRDGVIADYQLGSGETADASIRSSLKKLGIRLP